MQPVDGCSMPIDIVWSDSSGGGTDIGEKHGVVGRGVDAGLVPHVEKASTSRGKISEHTRSPLWNFFSVSGP